MDRFNKTKTPTSKIRIYVTTLSFFFLSGIFSFVHAADASLFLLPDTGVYTVGDEFPVTINIDTDGETITAVSGNVQFNYEQLEVVSISTDDSEVSSWIPKVGPQYSNETGDISFEGFISGGYSGERGVIAEITFRALQNVTSQVRFQGGSAILAADERATNILSQMNSGAYTLNPEEVSPELERVEYVAEDNTESSVITSTTHPQQNAWYQATTTTFMWDITDATRAVRLLLDKKPTSIPTIYYADPIAERTIEDIEEGVWYFHLQKQNDAGWGDVARYKIQIDTTKPSSFEMMVQEREDSTNPQPILELEASDELSGIRGYEVYVGDEKTGTIVESQGTSTPTLYQLPTLDPGEHTIRVRAIDYAGNDIEEETTVSIAELATPTITDAPQELTTEGLLVVKGQSVPNTQVHVFVSTDGTQYSERAVLSDAEGFFTYVMEETPKEGTYYIKLQAQNEVGARSAQTQPLEVVVTKPGIALYGGIVLSYLTVIVPLVGLLVLLVVFLWYGWFKVRTFRRRLNKEVTEAEDTLHQEFSELQQVTEEEIRALEKARSYRRLTPEEAHILKKLKGEVRHTQEAVEEEFKDVKDLSSGEMSRDAFHKKVEDRVQNKNSGGSKPLPQKEFDKSKMRLKVQKLQ